MSQGTGLTRGRGVQHEAQRQQHCRPGCSALERSMGTTAQCKSVLHYPPRLLIDAGSVTDDVLCGLGWLTSIRQATFFGAGIHPSKVIQE